MSAALLRRAASAARSTAKIRDRQLAAAIADLLEAEADLWGPSAPEGDTHAELVARALVGEQE